MPGSPRARSQSRTRGSGRTSVASAGGGGGGAPVDPATTVTAILASSEINTDNAATQAADGNNYTRWITNLTTTGTLRYTLSTPVAVQRYRITAPWGGTNACPKTWTFQGSNDGTNFTTLDTQTNFTGFVGAASPTFSFTNTTAYSYYRLNVSANNGHTAMGFAEMRLSGGNGIALLGGNGGTMVEWWEADSLTGIVSDGGAVAAADLVDLSGTHVFSTKVGTMTFRATGGPNSKPCIEHASTGAGFDQTSARQNPTADCTLFAVLNIPSTVNQQIFGPGVGGPGIDVNASKYRMMKVATAQLAVSTTNHPVGSWCAIIVKYTSATGSTKFRFIGSGTDTSETISGTATTFSETTQHIGWGLQDGTTNAAFRGSMALLGRYASALGSTDEDTLATYIKTKYGF